MAELESETNHSFEKYRPQSGIVIILTLASALIGLQLIGPLLVLAIYSPFYPESFMSLLLSVQDIVHHPELKMLMFAMQGAGAFIGLILLPFFIRKWSQTEEKLLAQPFYIVPFTLVIITVIVFMGMNSIFIEWNQNLKFPEFLRELEESLRSMEDKLNEASAYLTSFNSATEVIFAFFVIAVLAPIGEELVFRGILQRELFRSTKNIHLSIWIAAIIFSSFHLQFYGFLPRLLLGALFGYLYYWSGNLTLAILAHFVNNGFIVVAIYLHKTKVIKTDIEGTESAPWQAVIFSAIFTTILLYSFQKFYKQKNLTTSA